MREWQKPTVEETESGMEVTSYLPQSWIALSPLSLISERLRAAIRRKPGSPFRFLSGRAGPRAARLPAMGLPSLPFRFS